MIFSILLASSHQSCICIILPVLFSIPFLIISLISVILSITKVSNLCSHFSRKSFISSKSSKLFTSVYATFLSATESKPFSALANSTFSAVHQKLVFQLQLGQYIKALILWLFGLNLLISINKKLLNKIEFVDSIETITI